MIIEKGDLLFSLEDTFDQIDFKNKENLIRAFKNRIYDFWLYPAKKLDEQKHGFGSGLLCIATLEALARIRYAKYHKKTNEYRITKEGFVTWLKENIVELKDDCHAKKFYEDFRCGLVHEGHIKGLGQFSYKMCQLVFCESGIMMVNPTILLKKAEEVLGKYLISLREDEGIFIQFQERLVMDFGNEVIKAKSLGKL